jgi:sugar phosphate isomerase/epimerase
LYPAHASAGVDSRDEEKIYQEKGVCPLSLCGSYAAHHGGGFDMSEAFALELYSVRSYFQEDLPGCLSRVAALGYKGVEFFGPFTRPAGEVASLLAQTGLALVGWHTNIAILEGEALDDTVRYLQAAGCPRAIVPWMPPETFATRESVLAFAARLEAIRVRLEPHGLQLGYHNHDAEFNPLPDGTLPWALLMDNTHVIGQLDNGNAMTGSAPQIDTVKLVAQWPGRAVTVHLKPWSKKEGHRTMIGRDDIDWPAFIAAAKYPGGAQWQIVEYEEESLYDQFEGVKLCIEALTGI